MKKILYLLLAIILQNCSQPIPPKILFIGIDLNLVQTRLDQLALQRAVADHLQARIHLNPRDKVLILPIREKYEDIKPWSQFQVNTAKDTLISKKMLINQVNQLINYADVDENLNSDILKPLIWFLNRSDIGGEKKIILISNMLHKDDDFHIYRHFLDGKKTFDYLDKKNKELRQKLHRSKRVDVQVIMPPQLKKQHTSTELKELKNRWTTLLKYTGMDMNWE